MRELEAWQTRSSRNRKFYHLRIAGRTKYLCGFGHSEMFDTQNITDTVLHPACEIEARRLGLDLEEV